VTLHKNASDPASFCAERWVFVQDVKVADGVFSRKPRFIQTPTCSKVDVPIFAAYSPWRSAFQQKDESLSSTLAELQKQSS
jgi:hypothetical protein